MEKLHWGGIALLTALYFVIPQGESIFQIKRICEYMVFYLIGFLFEYSGLREKLFSKRKRWKIYSTLLLLAASVTLTYIGHEIAGKVLLDKLIGFINALTGTAFIFMLASSLKVDKIEENSLFAVLSQHNFDIYLYHEPLQFLILFMLGAYGILGGLNTNAGYGCLILLRFVTSIIISIVIGFIVKKVRTFAHKYSS